MAWCALSGRELRFKPQQMTPGTASRSDTVSCANSKDRKDRPYLMLAGPLYPEYGNKMQRKGGRRRRSFSTVWQCPSFAQTALVQGEGDGGSSWCLCYLGQYSVWSSGKLGLRRRQCALLEPVQAVQADIAGGQICRGLRILRACLCSCSRTCTSESLLIALLVRQERGVTGKPFTYQRT